MSDQGGTSLRTRTVKSLGIVLAFRAMTLVYQVFKARYLPLKAMGIVTIGENFVGFAQTFANPGIETAAVQVQGEDKAILNTAFLLRLAFAVPCYAAIWLLAPWWGTWTKDPANAANVTWVVRLVGLNLVIGVPSIVASAGFTRRLLFGRVESAQFFAIVVSSLLGIWLLRTTGLGYRAVAIAAVVNISLFTAVVCVMGSGSFALRFDRGSAGRLIAFGKVVFVNSLLIYLINNVDNTILGRVRGLAELAVYAVAFSWGNLVVQNFTQVASKVMFPTLSRLQGQPERFRSAYHSTLRLGAFLVCPAALGLAAVAPQFVHVVLGATWEPGVTRLLPWWCVYGCLRSFASMHGDALSASGHPRLVTWTSAVFLVLILSIGIPATRAGGALALTQTFLGVSFFANLLAIGMVRRVVGAEVRKVAVAILRPVAAALVMVAMVRGVDALWHGMRAKHLLALVATGMGGYVLASAVVQRATLVEAWRLLRRSGAGAASST